MWACTINYPTSQKEVIEKALLRVNELVFYFWENEPKIQVFPFDDGTDEEFSIKISYEDKKKKDLECITGHHAVDMIQAFIEGVLLSSENSNGD